jgi:hypothetical protein
MSPDAAHDRAIVRKDHDPRRAGGNELLGEFRAPLGPRPGLCRTVVIARGRQAELRERFHIPFPFGDVHHALIHGERLHLGIQLRQAKEYSAHAFELPHPPAAPVGPPKAEGLRFVSHVLIEEPTAFVAVVIARDFAPSGLALGRTAVAVVEEVRQGQAERGADLFTRASGVTVHEDAIGSGCDAEGRRLVVVCRTERDILALAARAHALEERDEGCAGHAPRSARSASAVSPWIVIPSARAIRRS